MRIQNKGFATFICMRKDCYGTYRTTVSGRFGGGFYHANSGRSAEQAVAFICEMILRYAKKNPDGWDLAAEEIMKMVPDKFLII